MRQNPPLSEEEEEEACEAETPGEDFASLIKRALGLLDDKVDGVVESKHLTDSPVRLAVTDRSGMHEMDRLRRMMGEQDLNDATKRRLELNRSHPLIRDLALLATQADENQEAASLVDVGIEQLYESALLMEGLHPNPADMIPRIQKLLGWAAKAQAGS